MTIVRLSGHPLVQDSLKYHHLGLANMLMWQTIKEERDGYSNIGRYRNIINVMLLCVMHGNNKTTYDTNLLPPFRNT